MTRSATLELMRRGSVRPIREVMRELAEAGSLDRTTHLFAEFVTHRPLWRLRGSLHPDSVLQRIKDKYDGVVDAGFLNDLIVKPVVPGSLRSHVITCLQEGHGDSVEVFEFLAQQRGLNGVAYFDKLVDSMARIAERPDWIDNPRAMFDGSFRRALDAYMAEGHSLKEISGLTFTKLGLYEWTFQEPAVHGTGFSAIQQARYDACYDLGGGFTTQYLADRFRQPLVCLDLFDPRTRAPHERAVVEREYAKYGLTFDKDAVPFRAFNVYTDQYPEEFATYLITSFGFLGSTPGDIAGGHGDDPTPSFATLHAAICGITRLIDLGKDVTIAVYGRPSATRFSNVCWTLRFADRRLVTGNTMTADFFADRMVFRTPAQKKWNNYQPVTFRRDG